MPTTFARPELLASPVWVAENHNRRDVRLLDCRWRVDGSGRRRHAEGHIPGALYIDWADELVEADSGLPFQLAGAEQVAGALGRLGVNERTSVVVFDDTYSLYATRVWWSLRVYGVSGARVLDGGWPAWLDSGQPISSAASNVEATDFTAAEDGRRRLSSAEQLAELVRRHEVQLIDGRTPAEYLGQGGAGPRRGHIAGAVNLPVALLVAAGSQAFPAASVLERLFAERGLQQARRTVTYDATGIGAAKLAFCLELMGFDEVAVYDGGWPDWAARSAAEFPIEP